MIVLAYKNNNYIVYSRARHDWRYSPDGSFYVDGGQDGYGCRSGGDPLPELVFVEIPYSEADLINDWNKGVDKLGIIDLSKETPVYKTAEDFKNQERPLVWGTFTEKGREFKFLKDLTRDHLRNILRTETHISEKYKSEIKKILELGNSQLPRAKASGLVE